ncbi:MAG: amidase, partial [Pirellulaceae bacterium]
TRFKAAGAVILGKTNVPEFLWAAETDNAVYGRTNNPYDLDRSPNGSSGGEAAIIAAAGSPLGVGSDAGGSIRAPAHFCGIAGLKPTHGRVPLTGTLMPALPVISRLDAAGPMARYVRDLEIGLRVLSGPNGSDPYCAPIPLRDYRSVPLKDLRIAFFTKDALIEPTAEIQAAVQKAADLLTRAGARVEFEVPPGFEATNDLAIALLAEDLEIGLRKAAKSANTEKLDPLLSEVLDIWQRLMRKLGDNTPAASFERHTRWHKWRCDLLAFFQRYDAIICPPDVTPAFKHGESLQIGDTFKGFEYASAFNLSGSPAAVVRCSATTDGLPIGVQIVGPHWREDIVLAIAEAIEVEYGGWKPPPL